MRINFEYIGNLQYEIRVLRAEVLSYRSGDAYRKQKEYHEKELRRERRELAEADGTGKPGGSFANRRFRWN